MASCSPRGYVLVVAEKPRAASKIASALAVSGLKRCRHRSGVTYWVLSFNDSIYVVAPAAGHLFGLTTDMQGFPVFKYEWRPLWEVEQSASYTKRFYYALRDLARRASYFVNACDYDIEGSVIGYMIIKFFGDLRRAYRAKFSALTAPELRRAFSRLEKLDYEMVEAGLARHELDWLWGINVSRALMEAVRAASGRRVVLSAGRVQSPTLLEAVRRDLANRLHVPLPEYTVNITLSKGSWSKSLTVAVYDKRSNAEKHASRLRGGEAVVVGVEESSTRIQPPYPFNLGDLQAEAARVFGYSPYFTQEVAEELYLKGLISYPRTNSQRIPASVDVNAILSGLSRAGYRKLVELVYKFAGGNPRPRNGPKDDPAHPAIHPTGEQPREKLSRAEQRIYDLIVRRFLASMARPAIVATTSIAIKLPDGGVVRVTGKRVVYRGWLLVYHPYYSIEDDYLPPLRRGDVLSLRVRVGRRLTKPPRPHTRTSLVKWMENVGIGTEATRARIVELLYRRGYLEGRSAARATRLGVAVAEILEEYFPEITSVELTRRFEEMLNDIMAGKRSRRAVVEEAKAFLSRVLQGFRQRGLVESGRKLAEWMGVVRPVRACPICGAPAMGDNGFCALHYRALQRVREGFTEWKRRGENVDWPSFLAQLASSKSSGELVREVAVFLASKNHG